MSPQLFVTILIVAACALWLLRRVVGTISGGRVGGCGSCSSGGCGTCPTAAKAPPPGSFEV